MTIIKILLFFTIITFFMPFFSVSCSYNTEDGGIDFSGLDISTGKYIGDYRQNGNLLGFILVISPVVLLALSFLIDKTKNIKLHNISKYIFFIAPIFDIFAAFVVRFAFEAVLTGRIRRMNLENIPVRVDIKLGFVLYIILNAVVFVFAVINYFNYFAKRE